VTLYAINHSQRHGETDTERDRLKQTYRYTQTGWRLRVKA